MLGEREGRLRHAGSKGGRQASEGEREQMLRRVDGNALDHQDFKRGSLRLLTFKWQATRSAVNEQRVQRMMTIR